MALGPHIQDTKHYLWRDRRRPSISSATLAGVFSNDQFWLVTSQLFTVTSDT